MRAHVVNLIPIRLEEEAIIGRHSYRTRSSKFFLPTLAALLAIFAFALVCSQDVYAQSASTAAGASPTAADGYGWKTVSVTLNKQIVTAQNQLKYIYGQLNRTDVALSNESLQDLSNRVDAVSAMTQSVQTQAASYQQVYESYLDIIGAKASDGENGAIVAQRTHLQSVLQDIRSTVTQGRLLGLQAKQIQLEVTRRSNVSQQALLSERIASPLSISFWSAVINEWPDVRRAFAPPVNNGYSGPLYHWPRLLGAFVLLFAIIVALSRPALALFRKGQQKVVHRFSGHLTTETHISFIPVALSGLLCGFVAFVLWEILSGIFDLSQSGSPALGGGIAGIMPICGFILGAGLPALSRIAAVDGAERKAARALWGVDWSLAVIVLIQTLLILFGQESALPVTTRRLLEALFTIVVTFFFLGLCKRLSRTTDARMIPAVYGLSSLVLAVTWIAIALGYLAFAFALIVWIVAISVSLASLFLLAVATRELTSRAFSTTSPLAHRLSRLGVHGNRMAQFGVLFSGLVNICLLIVFGAVCLSDGSLEFPVVAERVRGLFIGQTINGVQFSLNTAVFCVAILIAAYYAIRAFSQWMENRLFPTTALDIGARNSILNIFNYVAWITVFLLVLSEAGVTVKNLTWVVSALSVGIGFGLQAIVQNFVSGVILLAERPIRVGDLIELGSIKGDVKRISVRSTEIGLGDGSTMIVPNSQFITSAVRNATLGTALSAASATVTISPRADATTAQKALMDMMTARTDILQNPSPGVAISAITDTGITLALSAKVASVRDVGGVTNAIMLDAYRVLQEAGVEIGRTC